MIAIPGGEFLRGRTFAWADYDVKWYPNPAKDDEPVRKIAVDPFYIDQSEVTNGRFAAFVKATRHRAPFDWKEGKQPAGWENYPVVDVSWDDSAAFCAWEGKRLPTEAEWEHAARGLQDGKMYPWGDRKIEPADAVFNKVDGPQPVCGKTKNEFGLCDMIGNVWEWCSDWYGRHYYADAPDHGPPGPEKGMYRVLRGGSWFDVPPLFLTSSYRSWAAPDERSPTIGFRCAKSIPSKRRGE
ncbi:MAG: formylglycine-generating enzyme family protein [Acidobacteriota bacterium]|nr:formylglycine-generating enzyme family protein [Acidobacteriota bacterium]